MAHPDNQSIQEGTVHKVRAEGNQGRARHSGAAKEGEVTTSRGAGRELPDPGRAVLEESLPLKHC